MAGTDFTRNLIPDPVVRHTPRIVEGQESELPTEAIPDLCCVGAFTFLLGAG